MRHAYRLDEADTSWPDRAARPQDSPLAPTGHEQAKLLGRALAEREAADSLAVVKILASPFARTVQTAAAIATELGVGAAALAVEEGLCEDPGHMAQNKLCTEPFFLRAADLCVASPLGLDLRYTTKVPVQLRRGATYPGRPLEDFSPPEATEQAKPEEGEAGEKSAFFARVEHVARAVAAAPEWEDGAVVLVTHGAVCSAIVRTLA